MKTFFQSVLWFESSEAARQKAKETVHKKYLRMIYNEKQSSFIFGKDRLSLFMKDASNFLLL